MLPIFGLISGHSSFIKDELIMIPENINIRSLNRIGRVLVVHNIYDNIYTKASRKKIIEENIYDLIEQNLYIPRTYKYTDLIYNMSIRMTVNINQIGNTSLYENSVLEKIPNLIINIFSGIKPILSLSLSEKNEYNDFVNNYIIYFDVYCVLTNQDIYINQLHLFDDRDDIKDRRIVTINNFFGYITYPIHKNNIKNNITMYKYINDKIKLFCDKIIEIDDEIIKTEDEIINLQKLWNIPISLCDILQNIKIWGDTHSNINIQNYILRSCRGVHTNDIQKIDCETNSPTTIVYNVYNIEYREPLNKINHLDYITLKINYYNYLYFLHDKLFINIIFVIYYCSDLF
jgi:hypothetical protein